MTFSNLFAFMSGASSFGLGKTAGALSCSKYLGEIKSAMSSDILISLVTSEMFLGMVKSILVMLLVAVIAMLGIAIIKNGQNELPKTRKNGDSFFKRFLRLFLVALIVPVMAISGIGANWNVRKGNSRLIYISASEVDTDLYKYSLPFEQIVNGLKNNPKYSELFDENHTEVTFYINNAGYEVVYDSHGDYEVNDTSNLGKIYYGSKGDGYKKYLRAIRESTMYKVTTGLGGNYGYDGNTVSGFFVLVPIDSYRFSPFDGSLGNYQITTGNTYFFVRTNDDNKEAYFYYLKHLGLTIVTSFLDYKIQGGSFEVYKDSNKTYKPLELYSGQVEGGSETVQSGLLGFINKTRDTSVGSLYGSVSNFTAKNGTYRGCYFTFGPKGLMADGGFFANEEGSPTDGEIYVNNLKNGNSYFTSGDYNNKNLQYSFVKNYFYTSDLEVISYNNWNTMKCALKFTSMLPTGGSAVKVREALSAEEIANLEAQEGGEDEHGYENGSGQNYGSVSDEELNKNIDKTAVATYKRFIGIVNTILPFVIGFVLALAMFYGLNVAIRYARADEPEEKKKVKQKLINIIVGAIIAIVLTTIIILILNGDFIINILESMK